jgi:biopolymer transport protein ExbD
VQGLSITLPKPSNQPSTERHELLIVQIATDGALPNGAALSLAEIEQRLPRPRPTPS